MCVITARGGSKRIPHKNIRNFCGKPIIVYSIEAALQSNLFDEVMVSTDDRGIAEIATRYGANVPFMRSALTSNDYATTMDVLLEVLSEYRLRGREFGMLCCVYPTAPFVTADKLRRASDLLAADVDAVLPITEFSFPPQRGVTLSGDAISWWQPEHANARSQDLNPVYHDAGQFYFLNARRLGDSPSLLGERTTGYVVPQTEVQDIDNESDWELAEMKYERMVTRRARENA